MYLWNAYAGYNYLLTRAQIQGEYGVKGNTVTKKTNGAAAYNTTFYPLATFGMPSTNTTNLFMWVGTGTTEPQLLDYTVQNLCTYSETDGISISSISNGDVIYDEVTNSFDKTNMTLLRNNSSESVTITEVCLVQTNTKFSSCTVFYKELLANPITIDAGKYLEISFTSSFLDKSPIVNATVVE